MDIKKELIKILGVPENWDKYDYQTQRYSFDDVLETLEIMLKPKQFLCGNEYRNKEKRCVKQCGNCQGNL